MALLPLLFTAEFSIAASVVMFILLVLLLRLSSAEVRAAGRARAATPSLLRSRHAAPHSTQLVANLPMQMVMLAANHPRRSASSQSPPLE